MAEKLEFDYKKMLSQIDYRTSLEVEKLHSMLVALRNTADPAEKTLV